MPSIRGKKAFSLVETVLVMVILGICLTPFSVLLVNVLTKNAQSQAWSSAVSLAEGEMERVTALRFSNVTNESPAAFPAPFTFYSHQVTVDNVTVNNLNTPVAARTDYKRVKVKVTNSISGDVTLTTLVTNDW